MNHEKQLALLQEISNPERWKTYPGACAELPPQLVSCDMEKREAVFAFDTDQRMGNPMRILHGGIITVIFDNAMGTLAPACADGRFCVTVNMTVNFLHAQPLGTRVYVRARVVKAGRTLVFTEAEMAQTPEFAEICATVSGVYQALDREVP
jgi:uncharacterized protein (TIGR00369 family)